MKYKTIDAFNTAWGLSAKSFDELKTLAGSWEGRVNTVPPQADIEGKPMHVSLRVTSMGNTLMHEMKMSGRPDDPISMFHLDSGHLEMTHYCDAGNQPHFVATVSPDGKTFTSEAQIDRIVQILGESIEAVLG